MPALAINLRRLSEDQLIALEDALANYRVACDDYLTGNGSKWLVSRKFFDLRRLCTEAGIPPGQDPEGFVVGVVG